MEEEAEAAEERAPCEACDVAERSEARNAVVSGVEGESRGGEIRGGDRGASAGGEEGRGRGARERRG